MCCADGKHTGTQHLASVVILAGVILLGVMTPMRLYSSLHSGQKKQEMTQVETLNKSSGSVSPPVSSHHNIPVTCFTTQNVLNEDDNDDVDVDVHLILPYR